MSVALTPSFLTLPPICHTHSHAVTFPPYSYTITTTHRIRMMKIIKCVNVDADTATTTTIMCEPCNGRGWLVCEYCKGQKTNVKAPNNRIYRRCPSCKAVGYILCSNCKVFKCITFPDFND